MHVESTQIEKIKHVIFFFFFFSEADDCAARQSKKVSSGLLYYKWLGPLTLQSIYNSLSFFVHKWNIPAGIAGAV